MSNKKERFIKDLFSVRDIRSKKSIQGIIGIAVFAVFVFFTLQNAQALQQLAGYYGYYNGTYGYNEATTSSDALPSAPTSLSTTALNLTTATIAWTAPTTTTAATSLDNLNDYTVRTSTSSISDCTGGTDTGDTAVTSSLTGLTADTTYYVAVCANDTNGNTSAALTGTFDTAGALTSTNVQPATTTVGQTQTNTISFTLVNSLPATGKIVVTYPAGFDVSGAASGTCSTMDGSFATSVSGQNVTITRSAGSSEPAGAQTCTIASIVNPTSAGSAGTYTIKTTNSSDLTLDIDASVTADTFSSSSSGGGGGGGGGTTATTDDSDTNTEDATEGESTSYTVGTSRSISVGGTEHTVTVSSATALHVTLTIESDPIEVTVDVNSYEDVDTDGDGVNEVRIAYDGLDSDDNPQLTISAITADEATTCEMPSGTGTSPFTGESESITAVEAGDYIKSDSYSTVYYVTSNCGRRVFMDEKTYFTWQDDFDDLVDVTDATLSELSLEGTMLPKAGVVLVKIQSDPKVYALGSGSTFSPVLQWVTSEEVAIDLFGSDWADYVIDIEPTFFTKFVSGGDDIENEDDFDVDLTQMKKRTSLKG